MKKPEGGQKCAILVANGFEESHYIAAQKVLGSHNIKTALVSMDPGLVNSWGQGVWGLHFPVDQALSEALSADYDMVFIPGGKRGIDKLKLTAHTNRFIKGFFENEKPVFVCNTAVMLFEEFSPVAGRQITGPEEIKSRMERSGAIWQEQPVICDTNLVTSDFSSFANAEEAISSMWHAAFNSNNDMKEAA